jgi:hypothetical protein
VVSLATPVTTVVPTPPESDMERQEREREEEESREMGIEPEAQQRDMGPREIAMMEERHELHLISPRTWQVLHHVELEPKEHVLTLNVLKLADNYSQVSSFLLTSAVRAWRFDLTLCVTHQRSTACCGRTSWSVRPTPKERTPLAEEEYPFQPFPHTHTHTHSLSPLSPDHLLCSLVMTP